MLYEKTIDSPLGKLRLVASDRGLRYVGFDRSDSRHVALEDSIEPKDNHAILLKTQKELNEYFNGKRHEFEVPLELKGSVFQQKAWRALQKIGYGKTKSYGEQARLAGNPNAARAIGMANNRNPISIIIPCHRVIGADGSLVGYGGGIKNKEYLLNLEKQA
jgi:methylated-DNA-[protein]-cysteine S-methyltransferase